MATESNKGEIVLKCIGARDVWDLNTKRTDELVTKKQKGGEVQKPKIVSDHNKCKAFIDLFNQMKVYSSSLEEGWNGTENWQLSC